MKSTILFLVSFTITVGFAQGPLEKGSAPAKNFNPAQFDSYVQEAVKEWDVPGLAVVVVKADSVVFQEGYGVRELGKKEPVDEETIFAAGSTTKAFTAAAVGMLVDEGKLNWDDPVVEHLPEFKLKDPYLTQLITMRDLLTHRAGLPNTNFLWFDPERTTEEIIQRLELVEAAYPLRSGFLYQNIMYAVAGEVIEVVSGQPWEEFVRTRILDPVEMDRTYTTWAGSRDVGNIARPHDYVGEELMAVRDFSADAIGPAGSMWSNVADMSRWLSFLLRGCETGSGETLLKKSTCEELFSPQVVLPTSMYPTVLLTEPNWNTYGLGWFQHDYEGRKIDFHTGSLHGTVAIAGLIRDEELGIYMLANRDHAELRHALMYRVFDLFDEDPPRDWSTDLKELYDGIEEKREAAQAKADSALVATRIAGTSPTLPLEAYAGTYTDPYYGTARITLEGDELRFQFLGESGILEHWHYNTFRMHSEEPEFIPWPPLTFNLDASGKPGKITIFNDWELERKE